MRLFSTLVLLLSACGLAYAQAAQGPAANPPPGATPKAAQPNANSPLPGAPQGPGGPLPVPNNAKPPVPQGPIELSKEVTFHLLTNGINERNLSTLIRANFIGALEVKYASEEKSVRVKYEGTYTELARMEDFITKRIAPATLVDPLRLVFSMTPSNGRADRKTLTTALESIQGVKKANVAGSDLEVFADPGTDPELIEEKAAGANYKAKLTSHEILDLVLEKTKETFSAKSAQDEILKLPGVISCKVDDKKVTVLALKGRVNKQALKPILRKYGAETK